MSAPPLTYDRILTLFKESDQRFNDRMDQAARELIEQRKESDQRFNDRMDQAARELIEQRAESERKYAEQKAESERKYAEQKAEFDRQRAEFDRQRAESDRRMEESRREFDKQTKILQKEMGDVGSRIGHLVEHMIGGKNIVEQFQDLGYAVSEHSRNIFFGDKGDTRQIDLLLDDGDVAILVEVKTNLKDDDVRDHIEQLEAYRRWKDSKGNGKKRYIGALACAMATDNVIQFAQKKGMYVVVQRGNSVEIVPSPDGFKAKEW